MELITKTEYDKHLTPYEQGYVVYMQGAWPGSELKDLRNPYPMGTTDRQEWDRGEFQAVLDAQDSEK